jgi:hypothetical protein
MNWYKGNVHCHSSNSDGQLSPADTGKYYKAIGYDFLGLSDHHILTAPGTYETADGLIGIPCSEFGGVRRADVLGLWVDRANERFYPENFDENSPISEVYQATVDRVISANGIPVLCHPFWHWTFNYEQIKNVTGWNHFELCNASPDCNSMPTPGFSPADELWDNLLSNGRRVYGIATDDAHVYSKPYQPMSPHGGRGYIMAKAPTLDSNALRQAFKNGHFYASTGAELDEYLLNKKSLKLSLNIQCEQIATFDFFGHKGEQLLQEVGTVAEYKFRGDEVYVRVRIGTTSGTWLWTQPIFLDSLDEAMRWINS